MFVRLIAIVAVLLFIGSSQAWAIEFPPPKYTTTYHTVKKGETLGVLAGYYMLNPREWRKIRQWNPSEIRGSRIYPGQELMIEGTIALPKSTMAILPIPSVTRC